MVFEVGEKVVCVDGSPPRYSMAYIQLSEGRIYTISKLMRAPNGDPCVLVDGEAPHTEMRGWAIDRFRPLRANEQAAHESWKMFLNDPVPVD